MLLKYSAAAAVTAVMLALTAGSALAEEPVVVHNPGEFEITSEVDFAIVLDHPTLGHIPQLRCQNHWLADIDEDGRIHLDPANIGITAHASPPSTGSCDSIEACTSSTPPSVAEWRGDIEEEPDGTFWLHLTFCITGGVGLFDSVARNMECLIDAAGDDVTCDWRIRDPDGIIPLPVEVEGELDVDPPIDLAHLG